MYVYDTLSEAVSGLRQRGYDLDFNLEENCLVCHGDRFDITRFEITEFHRFEGDTDPSDEAVVYAIESLDGNMHIEWKNVRLETPDPKLFDLPKGYQVIRTTEEVRVERP